MLEIFTYDFSIKMEQGVDIKDITPVVNEAIKKSKIKEGVVYLTSIGSTGSITTIEYEPGVIEDLKRIINELAPPGMDYKHEKAWHDGNAHSHIQSALIGASLSISIRNNRPVLGTWQQIVLINHDVHPRERKITLTIIGRL